MTKTEKPKVKAKPSRNNKSRTPKIIKTPRQVVLVEKIAEVVGKTKGKKQKKITMGKLMREAGYSVAYSESPDKLTKTKGFQQLLEEYLPDDLIAEVHGDAIQASKLDHYVFPKSESDENIKEVVESVKGCKLVKIRKALRWKRAYFQAPDTNNRIKAIAEAYKVKNKYPAEKQPHQVAVVNVINYAGKSGRF